MIKLMDEFKLDSKEMREYYCDELINEAKKNPSVLCIDIDVAHSLGTMPFIKALPKQEINCGIMEQEAISMSAGLSRVGFIPFVHTFSVFASRRAFDQVFLSCAYQNLNVKIIGGDAGVTASSNGGTHMPFEDIGIMRLVPNMTVIEPADSTMYKTLIPHMANNYGNFYLRASRRKTYKIYDDSSTFEIGKANVLKEGNDVMIIASGILVYQALLAEEELEKENIKATVIDMHTIKPIDKETIIKYAERCKAGVTCENHNIIGGLGSAVDDVLSEFYPIPMEKIGVNDMFGQVGKEEYLLKVYHLTKDDIVEKVKKVLGRKK